jgi:UDP-N-acetylmuramoylalanine--D-glutamate ligase
MIVKDKKITILGAVRSGIGAAKLVKRLGGIPFISDFDTKEKLAAQIKFIEAEGIAYECGAHSERAFDCDFIITSPGVPSNSYPMNEAKKRNIKVISELEFASLFCKGRVIAITGTNGKTTTTALCAHLLNECGIKAYSAGNIGIAFSEIALDVKENEYVALETSSFQLDYIDTFKPEFSMILNITPDHLDRYNNNFDEYTASKLLVAKNQDEKDYLITNADDKNTPVDKITNGVTKLQFSIKEKVATGAYHKDGKMFFVLNGKEEQVCAAEDLFIKGEHNIANALSVLAVAKIIGLPNEKIRAAFKSFPGVEHRIEFVRELRGVKYYNDSKATNADSVWYALRSFDQPVYLILGGKDKGNDYSQIKEPVLKVVKKIYAIGVSAQKVYEFFSPIIPVEKISTLEDCVIKGSKEAKAGEVVLLSPACASFDMFNNYEHRGEVFKQAVMSLK